MVAKRAKTAVAPVISSKEEANRLIAELGGLQRTIEAAKLKTDEKIEALRQEAANEIREPAERAEEIVARLAAWAEHHRNELTNAGKTKTAVFTAGKLQWRTTPPAVSISNVKEVLATLKELGLRRFIRTKPEINKEALLREPAVANGIDGISVTQREEFIVIPNETEVENVRKLRITKVAG